MGLGKSITWRVSVYPASSSRMESVLSSDNDGSGEHSETPSDTVFQRQGFG